jgi:hypothetical protein
VRPELDSPRTTLLLHTGDVVLEDVEIDVEGGCVEVERVHDSVLFVMRLSAH